MEQQDTPSERPSVIPRGDIPISSAPEDRGIELRPFLAHSLLGTAMSSAAVSLAWLKAGPGQNVSLRSQPLPGLLIVLEGAAALIGRTERAVVQGDVITIPGHHEYGLTDVGENGFHALHVTFHEEQAASGPETFTLQSLRAENDARMGAMLTTPWFRLLQEGALDTPKKRETAREVLRVFSDAFQTLLFTRQAMCRDADYGATFNEHLLEEIGHNNLLKVSGNARIRRDPVLQATSAWFCHQMIVLDNAGKAVVNMVLETAGYFFHTLAQPVFAEDVSAEYFVVHAEGDEQHKDVGIHLLEGHSRDTYRAMHQVLNDSRDKLEAMTRRFAELIEREATAS